VDGLHRRRVGLCRTAVATSRPRADRGWCSRFHLARMPSARRRDATLLAGRLRWFSALVFCALVNVGCLLAFARCRANRSIC
jgi:hypothetical protein